ncbi:T6SS effector BTH_I2691 family protein [Kushneria sp. Sum13]|uniref:T6SS effector BTH_I2691 family protein n=1 Tax=Kushneria sp. Sum13 TaxID=3459196 RepID=UPI004045F143
MTTPNAATANSTARGQGCAGLLAQDCRYCMRQGLPILPVRYAVCQLDENLGVTPLPEDRIKELYPTDHEGQIAELDLQTSINEEGHQQKGTHQKSKYILRKLRNGFLYVYDEGNAQWFAYAISDTSELLQFPPSAPPTDLKPEPFVCNKAAHRASACLVTLPNVTRTGKAWFAYVESPWSEAHLERVAGDSSWREQNMQCFDVNQWLGSGQTDYAFAQQEIETLVPEYNTGQASDIPVSESLKEHRFSRPVGIDSHEDLMAMMNARIENNRDLEGKAGQGVMLAIKDEVGIIEELNYARQKPLEKMREFQGKNGGINARRSQWYASVVQLREALEQAAENKKDAVDEEYDEKLAEVSQNLEEEKDQFHRNWQHRYNEATDESERARLTALKEQSVDENGYPIFSEYMPQYRQLQVIKQSKRSKVENDLDDTLNEFTDYYDGEKEEKIKEDIVEYQKAIDERVPFIDADYAQWVFYGLNAALGRYDDRDSGNGLCVTTIISSALEGGVLSENSRWLWQQLLEQLYFHYSILIKAYLHNHRESIDAFVADTASLKDTHSFFGQLKLKEWFDQIKALRKIKKGGWNLPDFNVFHDAINRLSSTGVSTSSALLAHEAADGVASQQPPTVNSGPMVQFARLLQVNDLVMTRDGTFEQQASYAVEVKITMGEYDRTLRYLAHRDGSPVLSDKRAYRYIGDIENGERIGGNFVEARLADDTQLKVLWIVRDTELDQFASYVEADAIREGGNPRSIMLDEQTMMAEAFNKRLRDRLTGADAAFKHISTLFTVIGFFEAAKETSEKPASFDHWWRLVSSVVGVAQLVTERAAASQARKGLQMAGGHAMARVSTSVALEKIGKGFGVASSAIGIIDGFRTLSEAGVMARRGELSSRVKTKTFLGSISIAGGVLAIACGSLVLIPAVIGLMTLVGAYMLVQLVPLNIRTWLRRSLYGIEQDGFRMPPFEDAVSEQESLKMVFSGITIDLTKNKTNDENIWLRMASPYNPSSEKNMSVHITIESVSDLEGVIVFSLDERDGKELIKGQQYVYRPQESKLFTKSIDEVGEGAFRSNSERFVEVDSEELYEPKVVRSEGSIVKWYLEYSYDPNLFLKVEYEGDGVIYGNDEIAF